MNRLVIVGVVLPLMLSVEPVFGQIKAARGFRQFLLRGVDKVNDEWSLVCTAHNLLKLAQVAAR